MKDLTVAKCKNKQVCSKCGKIVYNDDCVNFGYENRICIECLGEARTTYALGPQKIINDQKKDCKNE